MGAWPASASSDGSLPFWRRISLGTVGSSRRTRKAPSHSGRRFGAPSSSQKSKSIAGTRETLPGVQAFRLLALCSYTLGSVKLRLNRCHYPPCAFLCQFPLVVSLRWIAESVLFTRERERQDII